MRMKTKELRELLIEIEVAVGDDYVDMADDEFEEEFEEFLEDFDDDSGDEDEDAYDEDPTGAILFRSASRQREIGVDAFRDEVGAKVAAVKDAEDLHVLAASIGTDGPAWQTTVIGLHPLCDVLTARLLYWDRAPHEVHAGLHEGDVLGWNAEAVAALDERARTIGFPEGLDPAFIDELDEDDIEELEMVRADYDGYLDDVKPDLDYSVEPYSAIPAVFR